MYIRILKTTTCTYWSLNTYTHVYLSTLWNQTENVDNQLL